VVVVVEGVVVDVVTTVVIWTTGAEDEDLVIARATPTMATKTTASERNATGEILEGEL